MAGRAKIKVTQYSSKGKYLRTYESQQEIRDLYYNSNKLPLTFQRKGKEYKQFHLLPDGTYVCAGRGGREALLKQIKLSSAPYLEEYRNSKVVELYNLLDKKIANFRSLSVASGLTGIDISTLYSRCDKESKFPKDGLIFKFKK